MREEAAAAAAAARTARGRSSLTLLVLVMAVSAGVDLKRDRVIDQQLAHGAALSSSPPLLFLPFTSFIPPSIVPAG